MVGFMSRRSWGALGGRWTEAESGVSWTSLGALLGAQMDAELTQHPILDNAAESAEYRFPRSGGHVIILWHVGHRLIATDDGLCVGNPLYGSCQKIHFPEQLYLSKFENQNSKCLHLYYEHL